MMDKELAAILQKCRAIAERQPEVEKLEAHSRLGEMVLEVVKEAIVERQREIGLATLADLVCVVGFIQSAPYDPDEHVLHTECNAEPGDKIYWWEEE
jgi:hypothetical protein